MTQMLFYVDESGDLGWTFTAPYRHGGSSRYLTIATLMCPHEKAHLPKRIIRNLYKDFGWSPAKEKKRADMSQSARLQFSNECKKLVITHKDIKLLSITVYKQRVKEHIRCDCNKLYNFMIKLSLIDEMCKYSYVELIPDPRSVKVESSNSLHDYLDINLAFEKNVETILKTQPCDSAHNKNIQFADMLAGLVQNHYEDDNSIYWNILDENIESKRLFY